MATDTPVRDYTKVICLSCGRDMTRDVLYENRPESAFDVYSTTTQCEGCGTEFTLSVDFTYSIQPLRKRAPTGGTPT